jgi:hypothetical protein
VEWGFKEAAIRVLQRGFTGLLTGLWWRERMPATGMERGGVRSRRKAAECRTTHR